jgi:hypothetical protein
MVNLKVRCQLTSYSMLELHLTYNHLYLSALCANALSKVLQTLVNHVNASSALGTHTRYLSLYSQKVECIK